MERPSLLVMAAGMGSRFGGLKQVAPIGKHGAPLLAFSLQSAYEAGFRHVVFVIKEEMQEDFTAALSDFIDPGWQVDCAYQRLTDLPEGFAVPEGRKKPWGTGQAVLAAAPYIKGAAVVINADDYYGIHSFPLLFDFLSQNPEQGEPYRFAMVGYLLKNTISEHGTVSRGICTTENGLLTDIVERTKIARRPEGPICFTEDGGATWEPLPEECYVSMNCWGFTHGYFEETAKRFPVMLSEILEKNPEKGEFYLLEPIHGLLESGRATVSVLPTEDRWYGVTYPEDLPLVQNALRALQDEGKHASLL